VPNEKKSASRAILSATSAARGTSIIVPISAAISTPSSSSTRATVSSMRLRTATISSSEPISGTMISGSPWADPLPSTLACLRRCSAAWAETWRQAVASPPYTAVDV